MNERGVTTWQTRCALVPRGCASLGRRPRLPFHGPCGPSSTTLSSEIIVVGLRPIGPLCPRERRAAHRPGLLPVGFAEKYLSASTGDEGTGRTLRRGPPPTSDCSHYWSCSPSDDDDWLSPRLVLSLPESYAHEHAVESVDWLSSSIGRGSEAGEKPTVPSSGDTLLPLRCRE